MKPTVQIKETSIRDYGAWKMLVGHTLDHPKLGNNLVYTSPIVSISDDGKTIETENTIYKVID